jgi:hypothetical protein
MRSGEEGGQSDPVKDIRGKELRNDARRIEHLMAPPDVTYFKLIVGVCYVWPTQ